MILHQYIAFNQEIISLDIIIHEIERIGFKNVEVVLISVGNSLLIMQNMNTSNRSYFELNLLLGGNWEISVNELDCKVINHYDF